MTTNAEEIWFEITFSAVDADDLELLCKQGASNLADRSGR